MPIVKGLDYPVLYPGEYILLSRKTLNDIKC